MNRLLPDQSDNFNRMTTITDEIYLLISSNWDLEM